MEEPVFNTEYDDVFRTLLNDFPYLAIPLINEIFGYNYSPHDEVHLGNNELFIRDTDGKSHKRITDSSLYINDDSTTRFHIECQSTEDETMLIRMYEYDTQIAINNSSTIEDDMLTVRFPNSGILYLRSSDKVPKTKNIRIIAGDQQVIHKVHIIKMKDYTLEEIFKKKLLFLLPFYIFNLESRFKKPKKNDDYMKQITSNFSKIHNYLNNMLDNKQISDRLYHDLREFINRVADQIAQKHDDVKKGVTNIMGGKIIMTTTKRYYNSGVADGFNLGGEKMSDLVSQLYSKLFAAGRIKDAERAFNDKNFREQLMKEFGLEMPKDIPDNLIPDTMIVN